MSAALEDHWHHVLEGAYAKHGPAAIAALVAELEARGDLADHDDRLAASLADELRADYAEPHNGKLAKAIALIKPAELNRECSPLAYRGAPTSALGGCQSAKPRSVAA